MIEANKTTINFLDVTLPNNVPRYVHNKSNHPPTILKNIPESINKRLSEISSDEESFKKAAAPYQQSINNSGYDYELRYEPPVPNCPTSNEETVREESSGTTPHIAETYLQTSGVNFSRYWTKNSRKTIL
jgi:hypothetical protein